MEQGTTTIIKKTTLMHLMDTVGIALFVASLAYLILNWSNLPAKVPTHFGFKGEIDRYGPKWELFLLPFITLLVGIALQFLETHPEWHNSPIGKIDSNMERIIKQSILMLSFIRNMSFLLFALVIWETIHIAQGNRAVLEGAIWIILALIILFPTIMTLISSVKDLDMD
ncbi:DUF1648 domain-containing protein [Rummeliibacillus pycnus]|uniref:DUF1648 domain-containing protein n=1 Tax=Rummeliibacillus pycnus TaxID=101070 RepID=UPI0037CC5866